MPNPFGKSRPTMSPYAIYTAGDITWHVTKTYKMPKSEAKDQFARWMVQAKSSATFGSFEGGDTYRQDILRYGRLVAATPEWIEHYGTLLQRERGLPTPEEYLEQA
jgi:hypothetical protein